MKNKPFIVSKLPDGRTRRFYEHPKNFKTKKNVKKKIAGLKKLHKPWNKKLYYRTIKKKDRTNKTIYKIYIYSTEPNFMEGFRGK